MAKLTTLNGKKIEFTPGSVVAVTDHDLNEIGGNEVTCIYGITAGAINIAQPIKDFIAGLGLAGEFFAINLLNGLTAYLSAPAVKSVLEPEPGVYSDAVKAVISVGDLTIAIAEDMDSLTKAINAHGGNV